MDRIDRREFSRRFPPKIGIPRGGGIVTGPLVLDKDLAFTGIVKGDVVVRPGTHASIGGVVEGSLVVEKGAVAYCDAVVKGGVLLGGALCIDGSVAGSIRTTSDATLALDGLGRNIIEDEPGAPT